jgi:hypothetical protein
MPRFESSTPSLTRRAAVAKLPNPPGEGSFAYIYEELRQRKPGVVQIVYLSYKARGSRRVPAQLD